MLKASFVRTIGERDRIYVVRSDGTEVSWVFATYGDAPPHDMIHLVVESAFDVKDGFWGRVDAGADPRVITERANRIGGSNKYSAFGEDLSGLALAEALANPGWLMESHSVEAIRLQILEGCRQANLAAPAVLTPERVAKVRAALEHLAAQWRGLNPKGAIQLVFDPTDPTRGFEQL